MEEKEVVADTDSHPIVVALSDNHTRAGNWAGSAHISVCLEVRKMKKKTGCICVECGSQYADCGSLKHPYCKKCFEIVFGGDYEKYNKFIKETHHFGLLPKENKRTFFAGIKMVLWQWGFGQDKCPYCGSELMEHGFFPNGYFTCLGDKDCPFNDGYKKWLKEYKERMK